MKRTVQLFVLILAFGPSVSAAELWFVGTHGDNGNSGRSYSEALATFSAAIDSASNSAGSDTLLVVAGDTLIGSATGQTISGTVQVWAIEPADSLSIKRSCRGFHLINSGISNSFVVYANGSTADATFWNCAVHANEGGIAARAGFYSRDHAILTLHGCSADGTSDWGYYSNLSGDLRAFGCTAHDNQLDGFKVTSNSAMTLTACLSLNNSAGKGFFAGATSMMLLESCRASGNPSGVYVSSGSTTRLTDCVLEDNGFGIFTNNADSVIVEGGVCSTFSDYGITGTSEDTTNIVLSRLIFCTPGPGATAVAYLGSATCEADRVTIHGLNHAAGLLCGGSGTLTTTRSIITHCTTGAQATLGSLLLSSILFWNNSADLDGVAAPDHVLRRNPLFLSPASSDFRLMPISPAAHYAEDKTTIGAQPVATQIPTSWGRPAWSRSDGLPSHP
ncbi:MAG: right-handed parallel beta-helix repeat-containing protein [bacterium]